MTLLNEEIARDKGDEYTSRVIDLEVVRWAKAFGSLPPAEQRALLFRGRIAGYPSASAAFNRPLRPHSAGAAANGFHDAEQQFREAAAKRGLIIDRIIADGEPHRCDVEGKGGKSDGSYLLRMDGGMPPWGWFENHRDGMGWQTWKANGAGQQWTEAEKDEFKRKIAAEKAKREKKKAEQYAATQARAEAIVSAATEPPADHPYFIKKGIKPPHGVLYSADPIAIWSYEGSRKTEPGVLIVPMRDIDGTLWSVQFIEGDGHKDFLGGGRKQGCFFAVSYDAKLDPTGLNLPCEGLATGASCHEAANAPALCAFDAGNLSVVIAAVLKKHPLIKLLICGDDDHTSMNTKGELHNTGRIKGEEAAKTFSINAVFPVFDPARERHPKWSDFNDLHQAEGLDAVRECFKIAKAKTKAAPPPLPDTDAAVERLRKLKIDEYERCRIQEAADLGFKRVSVLDQLVEEARQKARDAQKQQRAADAQGAQSSYTAKPDFPPDNIGAIAGMEIELTSKGEFVSRSYLNAAISIARHLNVRGRLDTFHNRRWIAFKGELVNLDDDLIGDIHTEVAKDLGTDGGHTNVKNVLNYLSGLNKFHPVQQYLDGLRPKWDGKKRMRIWLAKALGCDAPPRYRIRVGIMFLVSMVARIMDPGCQVDYVLIIEGDGGLKKSSALRILAKNPEWFSDSLPTLNGRDEVRVSMAMRGLWLAEIPEMHALGKADNDYAKAFITRRIERYIAKYGRTESYEPRQCVFAGTTNRTAYFTDETGNRRYWPIYAHKVDLDWLRDNVDQLLAEAVHAYDNEVTWWPSVNFEKWHIKPQQDDRRQELALEEPIRTYLDERAVLEKISPYWPVGEKGFQFEIWQQLKGSHKADIDFTQQNLREINGALRHLGYSNKSRRYSNKASKREMTRKWWPPEEKMHPKVKEGLDPSF